MHKISFELPAMNSITFRVPFIILVVLLFGIGFTVAYYLQSQNSTIIETKQTEIRQEANILFTSIKNNMLAGEAPIAVELFKDFRRANFVSEIKLYRSNGVTAFSDNETIKTVNRNIKADKFKLKKQFPPFEKITSDGFKKSVDMVDDVFLSDTKHEKIIIFKPLINQPKCSACHGLDHVVRGVITIAAPVDEVYRKTRINILISILLYGIVVFILTSLIIIFLKRTVISRILLIGEVVQGVGQGDFKTKTGISGVDEIGELAGRIDRMIDGLHERFKLTKFVSRATLDHVQSDEDIMLGGTKKTCTVLFSDIRGFTRYSENRDPDEVMSNLNDLMILQAGIVQEYGGDIDKFVGDELMAVFDGENMVLRAVKAAEKIRAEIKKLDNAETIPFAVGIGINTGEMIMGNMGSADRIDRTVIGDAVNLGARLCSIAGRNTIVLSEYSYKLVKDRIIVKEHGPVKVKGKEKPVKIYTLRKTL